MVRRSAEYDGLDPDRAYKVAQSAESEKYRPDFDPEMTFM